MYTRHWGGCGRRARIGHLALLLPAALGLGCGAPRPAKSSALEAARTLPPFDIATVVRRVAGGLRPEGAGWSGGRDTFSTRVAADGTVLFAARRPSAATGGPAAPSLVAPPFSLKTIAIAGVSATGSVDARGGQARVDAEGSVVIERGAVRERFRNLDDGLEQAWELAARPSGSGDLAIRVRTAGLAFAGETAGGLHFVDRASGLGVRYGAATWIDGRGLRTPARVDFVGGELRVTVPRAVLDGSAYPAVLDPYLTPEFGLDNPVRGPGTSATSPAVAFDGTNTLVVWTDYRQTVTHLFATRVSAAGTILDPAGISIGTTTATQANPAVVFGGSSYLVVWEQGSSTTKVYASRVNPSGMVLDPAGVAVSTNTISSELRPAVSYDGTNFLVAWAVGTTLGGRIAASRLSAAGKLLDTTSLTVSSVSSSSNNVQGTPASAFDGANTLVAWVDGRSGGGDIYANRVSTSGQILDGNGFVVASTANGEALPKLAFDGTNVLAVWVELSGTSLDDSSIRARRIAPTGALLDASAITVSAAAGQQTNPVVAFDGTSTLVAWTDYRGTDADIYGSRVGSDGTVTDPQGLAVISAAGGQTTPALVGAGGRFSLAWGDNRGRTTVYAARVGSDGVSLDGTGFPLPIVPNSQTAPAAASDGSRYFVVWGDQRTDAPGIRGVHVTTGGQVVESSALQVSASTGSNTNPVVAWNGSSYLVVWLGTNVLLARRFSAAGTPLDAADIPIPSLQLLSDVVSNGTDFLVVGGTLGGGFDIQGARVSAAGVLLDTTAITICAASGDQFSPKAAFDGTNYFVVWGDNRDTQGHAYGARVTAAGAVLDPDGFLLSPPTGVTADYQSDPHVAFDGTNYFVAWADSRNGAIRGTRVTPAGAVLDTASVLIVAPSSNLDLVDTPNIVFDGTNYVVTWQETQLSQTAGAVAYSIGATLVSPAPAIVDGYGIASDPSKALSVALASDRAGTTLFTWAFPTTLDGDPVTRAQARILAETAPAGTCNVSSQCATGFCVDGFCCDTACGGGSTTDCLACSVAAGAAANGTCGAVADGHGCDDANACTSQDVCRVGVCAGAVALTCGALDVCHAAGTCAPATGLCSNPSQPNGTPCPGGLCTSGVCGQTTDAAAMDAGVDALTPTDARPDSGGADGPPAPDATGRGGATGAAGTGGAAGAAGTGGATGAAGKGGAAGTGAAAGTGGGPSGTAGGPGGAGNAGTGGATGGRDAGATTSGSASSGCGCDLGVGDSTSLLALALALASAALARRAPAARQAARSARRRRR